MIKVGFIPGMQGFFSVCKSISVNHHIKELKNKNYMIIPKDTEKASDKTQYPFMTKLSGKWACREPTSTKY